MNSYTISRFDRLEKFLDSIQADVYEEPLDNKICIDDGIKQIKDKVRKDSVVLDVGCGQGYALKQFEELECNPIGITTGEEDYQKCKADGHDVRMMDMSFIEFEDDYFDFIWARHCLEHSVFPYFTLTELKRVCKPLGWLYLEVPAPDTVSSHEYNKNHYSVAQASFWFGLLDKSGWDAETSVSIDVSTTNGADIYYRFIARTK